MPNPDAVTTGPGLLYVGAYGVVEPTSATGALDAGYRPVGYTEEGTTFNFEFSSEDVLVAEELLPIRTAVTGQTASVAFSMAEVDRKNMILALNVGVVTANTGGVVEPPAPGNEQRISIVLQTDEGARWLFRKCLQAGSLGIDFKKAPAKKLLPVSFKLEFPTGGARPFAIYPNAAGIL